MPKQNFVINEVHAIVSVDPKDANEGVIATLLNDAWMPLISADNERLEFIIKEAERLSKAAGISYKVIRFSSREDVTEQVKKDYGI